MLDIRKAHELDLVEVLEDLPEYNIKKGEIGVVVEAFDNPDEAYDLEFVDESGESRFAYAVKPNQIRRADESAREARSLNIPEAPEYVVRFGDPQRQTDFGNKYVLFLKCVENLRNAWEIAFEKSDTTNQDGRVFTFMARMAIEDDFLSMILLCANGHSNGAKQILRGLFEKAVTLGYLHKHPEEMERFNNHSWIHRRKELDRIGSILAGKLRKPGQKSIAEIKAQAKNLKDTYDRRGWSRLSSVEMARDIGLPLQVIEVGYYWGLEESHPTVAAIIKRLKVDKDGSVWYEVLPDLAECDIPLMIGHYLVATIVAILGEYFEIEEVDRLIPQCMNEFKECWGSNEEQREKVS